MEHIFSNKICSYYKNIVSHTKKNKLEHPGKNYQILDILTKEGFTNHSLLTELRQAGYGSKFYDENKRKLSAACFSSVQNDLSIDRCETNHLFHTGFLSFDIDVKENEILSQKGGTYELKEHLISKIPYIAYMGLSVSAIGIWGLIPIKYRDDHTGHYAAMVKEFKEVGVFLDTAVYDVSRLRFIAYDEDAHVELEPELFIKTEVVQENKNALFNRLPDKQYETDDIFFAACKWVEAKHEIQFKPGMRHMYLTYLYSNLRYARVSRHAILEWVYKNIIPANEINSNCLDELELISKV